MGTGTIRAGTRRWAVAPGVIAFVASPAVRARPHAPYRLLRRIDPVHQSPIGAWVLSSYEGVATALRHSGMGSDERKADPASLRVGPLAKLGSALPGTTNTGAFSSLFHELLLVRDPPDHTRIRSLVNKAFTPRGVELLEPRIRHIADVELDKLAARGSIELLSEFAYPFPARVICELMGAPPEDHTIITRLARPLARRLDPDVMRSRAVMEAGDRATVELTAYLEALIAQRRATPGSDLLSALIAAEDGGDRLSHDELIANLILLMIAGHETTANLLGNGLAALLAHPNEMNRLRRNPDLDRTAVEELLRYDGPVQMAERVTLEDVEVCGRAIPKGRIIVLCLAAANRDPAVFDEPDRLDVGRSPNPHVAFGGGAHFCLGAPLARLEARVALRGLLDRFPDLHTTGTMRWRPSFTIRGLNRLDLAW
jgi:cytochrome P450